MGGLAPEVLKSGLNQALMLRSYFLGIKRDLALELGEEPRYVCCMRSILKCNRTAGLLAAMLLLLATQLALLGHVVLVDHEQEVGCEVCLKSQQAEPQLTAATFALSLVILGFLARGVSSPSLHVQASPRAYCSRAPPVLA